MNASTPKKNGKKGSDDSTAPMDPQAQLQEIQHLLFGQHVADVRQAIEGLGEQCTVRFSDINKKVDDLTEHVQSLHVGSERRASIIEDEAHELAHKLANHQQQTSDSLDVLEAQFLAETKELAAEFTARYQLLTDQLKQSSGDLSNEKVGRSVLAQLLAGMADQLENCQSDNKENNPAQGSAAGSAG